MADELRAHPGSIVFNAVQGHSLSETRAIFIFSTYETTMNWSQSTNVSWLTANAQNGQTEGVLLLSVNAAGLQPGTYDGNVTLQSPQSSADPVVISVTLIVNPDVPVKVTRWKDGYSAAMSVSVDSRPSGYDELQSNGFKGTYFFRGTYPDSYLTDYYNAGMEIGAHTVNHSCVDVADDDFRTQELEPNILGICTYTPEPCNDIISFAWPCGYTSYRMQSVAAEYYMSARGYNINKLEDATPYDFMNLKCYNSHEHTPFPPSDLRTVIDEAIVVKKWFNLVLHEMNDSFTGDVNYAHSKDIWVSSIGTVIKYILQRDRFTLTDFNISTNKISYNVSRLPVPSSISKNFEAAFGSNDLTTMEIDVDDSRTVDNVLINGVSNPYQTKVTGGNKVLLTNVVLDPYNAKAVEIIYHTGTISLTISGVTASSKVYDGTTTANLNNGSAVLIGVVPGDAVNLVSTNATGTFTDKKAGTGKSVTTSNFTLSGTDAGKYKLLQPTVTASITKANLTISGISAINKVYNSTTSATLNSGSATLVGIIGTDVVSLVSAGASGTFANKNAGNAKTVTTAGFSIGGTDAANYILIQPSASANITKAGLTILGVTASNKVYDGTTAATLNTGTAVLTGVFGGDVVNLVSSGASGAFINKNAGNGKAVNVSGLSISGTDAVNYTFNTTLTTTANITRRPVTITADAKSKVYGDSDPTLTWRITSGDLVVADDITGYLTRDAGENIGNRAVTQGTLSPGSNYNLIYLGANLTITSRPVTIMADAKSKVYGESDPVLTFVSIPAEGSALTKGEVVSFTGALSRAPGEVAGIYAILQNTLTNSNYNITYIGADLTINLVTATTQINQGEFGLKVFPNPFTDHLYFDLQLNKNVKALVEIFNVSGVKMATIFSDDVKAGQIYRIEYIPDNVSIGILFYRLVTDGQVSFTGKLVHR